MTRSFFRALDGEGVRYLLISGQAAILYGASTFSEDVDLWVDPAPGNWRRLRKALVRVRATVYKLTPPLTPHFVNRGHGFHFQIPPGIFLDVMGVPPRVRSFEHARRSARTLATDWGELPVVSPEDLVLLKRTDRPADYDVISNLVARRVLEGGGASVLRWALENTFRVEDLAAFAIDATKTLRTWPKRVALRALGSLRPGVISVPERKLRAAAVCLGVEMNRFQAVGREYWTPIIDDLRQLRAERQLIPEGTSVKSLL